MTDDGPRPYLLAWRLDGRRVLVVGGGETGTAEVETLQGTGARTVIVDPSPTPRLLDMAERGEVTLRRRRFRPRDVVGVALVVAATDDSKANRRIRRWARLTGAVVNAVDDPANCDVTVPSAIVRGPATIAITTGGHSPAAARYLREALTEAVDAAVPMTYGSVIDIAGNLRNELPATGRYRYDYATWRDRLFRPAMHPAASSPAAISRIAEAFRSNWHDDPAERLGHVSLVGAGPGGRDLLTLRGAYLLSRADIVVHDRLADPELLAIAPVAAKRVPVGKRKGGGVGQDEINDMLIAAARRGERVVRLKGGDPFVFGRGGEEVDVLAEAGIEFEVVPGVSSALAAPALAGVPLTDRRSAASFTVVTGHRISDAAETSDAMVPTGGSLVVLMAASTAAKVAVRLCEVGWAEDEHVLFVHNAGREDQAVATRTLVDVRTDGCPFPSPTVMMLGPTVAAQATRSTFAIVPRGPRRPGPRPIVIGAVQPRPPIGGPPE